MIYMRGQARDYDNWARLTGEEDWSWENSLEDFKAHEDHYKLDDGADPFTGSNSKFSDMHGNGGEWRVERQRLRWDVLDGSWMPLFKTEFGRPRISTTGIMPGSAISR